MLQWYSKFIKNYADLCEPLYNPKKKLKKVFWSVEAQKAFDVVKSAIMEAPDFKKPFQLFTDASSMSTDAVLNQEQRPVVYASRTLSSAKRNYTVTKRESLAVVWALNNFRTYLGSRPVKVITDHAAMTRLTNDTNLSRRMIRNPVESTIGEKVNCAIIRDLELSLLEQLIEEQRKDPELGHIYRYLENTEDSSVDATICEKWSCDFRLIEGLFYVKYATMR
ncbi:retrovirus-related Pol polyprotein from transposon 297 [Trichonephila clavipes]|nr:retrovirus-related Pol polyprotein from transposon 297 [Trichonephila clavipes]